MFTVHSCFSEIKQKVIICRKPVDIQIDGVQMNNWLNYYAVDTQTHCTHFDYMFEYQKNPVDLLQKRWPFLNSKWRP